MYTNISGGKIKEPNLNPSVSKMKVALVYDRVNKWGGAERVLLTLHEMFPEAPLYTSVYSPQKAPWAKVFPKIIPSFLQKFPFAIRHELYATLMPLAFESFSFDEYDLVISVTSEAAKGIITKPQTLHICYCLTPIRYLWSGYDDYFKDDWLKSLTKPVVSYLRAWDKVASQRPDYYIAISQEVQKRIKRYYGRESEVVYPPVDPSIWQMADSKLKKKSTPCAISYMPYFLVVSRLVPYKRVDIVIEAFNELGWPLKIIGTGRELGKLRRKARPNIEFLGNLTEEELVMYYEGCRALIFAGVEDFGLSIIEAQAAGKPVLAYRGGGVLESIVEGKTGEFFEPQTKEALIKKIKSFKPEKYDAQDCKKQAQKFSKKVFKKRFRETLENYL